MENEKSSPEISPHDPLVVQLPVEYGPPGHGGEGGDGGNGQGGGGEANVGDAAPHARLVAQDQDSAL